MSSQTLYERFGITETKSTNRMSLNWPEHEMGVILQRAAEAGSETKRVIEVDPNAIRGQHRDIVVGGLRAIAAGRYGSDYHGVDPGQAANLLHHFEWPLEAEAV